MKVVCYEGIVENGCVHLLDGELLPDGATVYVVVPGISKPGETPAAHIRSPRLLHPEQASDFVLEVIDPEERTAADVNPQIPKSLNPQIPLPPCPAPSNT